MQLFWNDLAEDGRLKDLNEISPSPESRTDIGSLGLVAELKPQEEVALPMASWAGLFPFIAIGSFQVIGNFSRSFGRKQKKALEYAWVAWDKDKDGLLEGKQHNIYEIEFYGPHSILSSIYLGAFLAGSKMAEAMGEKDKAREYQELWLKGKTKFDELLWNGEYYVQKYEEVMTKKHQYGKGCLSDQLLGHGDWPGSLFASWKNSTSFVFHLSIQFLN